MTAGDFGGSYRDLKVWQKAIELVDAAYEVSGAFPEDERFALTSQMRRSAISVPSNIAEGYGRMNRGDYVRFLRIANGSLKELETQLIIAGRRKYLDKDQARPAWDFAQEVGKMLNALIKSLT